MPVTSVLMGWSLRATGVSRPPPTPRITRVTLGTLAGMGVSPLLLTKIEPPRIRPGHVPRRELVERLRHGLHRRLNLVSAPAGWGKTTLLAEWLTAEEEIAFAWLSLDEEDNDPARFWAYVAAALRRADVDVPAAFEAAIAAPGIGIGDAALPLLLNALVASPQEHVFVLDDYHVIREPAIHDGVRFVLAHLPVVSHLVIATRADPPVDLSRLRARGELGEVLTEQLRFSDAEAAALLNDSLALALPPEDLEALRARTEGWAAGLYLAGLSLRDRPGPARPGDLGLDRHLVDYLGDEVLSAQTAQARAFLLDTCILDRFNASLCDAVRDEDTSKALLGEIERANLFLVPLDERRAWFRYHHVFREVLRRELQEARSDDEVATLHARAGSWNAEAGDVSTAIGHLLAAGSAEAAADLIAASWNAWLQTGRSATVTRWLDALPEEVVVGDPRLCLARAWLALDSGEPVVAERWATATEGAENGRPLLQGGATVASSVAMLRATLAYRAGDLATAEAVGARAVALEGGSGSAWRAVGLATLGAARYFRGGPSDEVAALLEQAIGAAQAGANSMAVLRAEGTLAAVALGTGDLGGADRWVQAADALRERESLAEYWMGSLATAVAGRLAAEAGDLERAQELLRRAVVLARRGAARPEEIYALAALAPIESTLGDGVSAAATLRSARAALRESPSPGTFPHLVDDAERRLRGRGAPHPGEQVDELSTREMSVLRLLGSELSMSQIGDELYISRNTVKTHVRGIYRKLDADTRAAAVARARELRLL
jgi:LuxR family transcriptional regulator, maltose regulon positive regulatory protein